MLNRVLANQLIDYYGNLLTEHQLNILKDYFEDDLSMNEIAENLNISKAAVSDNIKRAINQLKSYEDVLKCIEKDDKLDKIKVELEKGDELSRSIAKKIGEIIER